MTQAEVYDWLITQGIKEPACVMLGTRCVAGRWQDMSEQLGNGAICRIGRIGIHVLGEGDSWAEAHAMVASRLA